MIPIAIVASVLAMPQPTGKQSLQVRSYQEVQADDLDVTVRGCLWRGVDTPAWCGPPIKRQGRGELRMLREHLRREVRGAEPVRFR